YSISRLAAKTYQLRFAPVNMGSEGMEAYLIDNYLNSSTSVSLTDSSFINITVTSDAKSGGADRFKVVFKKLAVLPVTFTSISAAKKGKDIIVQWKVENESGIQQYEVEKSEEGIQFTKAATYAANNSGSGNYSWLDEKASSGYSYYRVRSVGQDAQVQYTQIVKVLIGKFEASMAIYPNPIVDETIQIQFNNQPAGVYRIKLLTSLGQVILSKEINHSEGNSTKVIHPDQKLAKGVYQLEVVKPGGIVEVMKVVN
ncbi:MAG: T9SS type A sorting domain-containing protein, partial [Ginsengibacter sp.]